MPAEAIKPPVCPYCGATATLRDSIVIYRKSYGDVWICPNYPTCDSFVGCHPNKKPLGGLANKELREARKKAHVFFDGLWGKKVAKTGCTPRDARTAAYRWLSKQMNLGTDACHIGMFDAAQCAAVVKFCGRYLTSSEPPGQE